MNPQQQRKELLKQAVERSSWDPAYFLRFFLPKWFPTALPPFHMGMVALLTRKVAFLNEYPECHAFLLEHFKYAADPSNPESILLPVFQKNLDGKMLMVAGDNNNWIIPRGFSKTTICNGCNLYDAITDGTSFTVHISSSAGHAETQLGNIRLELEQNELLRDAYGDVVPTRSDSEKWTAGELQLRNGAILMARGRGGQVRGMNYRARRPNHIVLDDVEDEDDVRSPTVRDATQSWFYGGVVPAGVMMDGAVEAGVEEQIPLRVTNLATLLGPEALAMTLARDPEFNTVKFGAKLTNADGSEAMLWEYKMKRATYDRMRSRYQRLGKLAEFTREYDSAIRVSDEAIFPSIFIYQPTPLTDLVHRSQALDPAISDQPGRDHAALIVAGRRASDGALWFLDEWGGLGKTPRDKIDAFFEMHKKWATTHNGIEAQQYQKSLIFLMREEMGRRGYFFHITPIVQGSKVSKDDRIVGTLSPRYSNGYIRHLRPLPNLEGNLADWPNGKKDYADAAAMALTLLGESQMLVIAEAQEAGLVAEQEPLETLPPPLWHTAGNFVLRGASPVRSGRYG